MPQEESVFPLSGILGLGISRGQTIFYMHQMMGQKIGQMMGQT